MIYFGDIIKELLYCEALGGWLFDFGVEVTSQTISKCHHQLWYLHNILHQTFKFSHGFELTRLIQRLGFHL